MSIGIGVGCGIVRPLISGVEIPESGPDSFGDGSSLVAWLDMDNGVTLNGADLESVVDQAALASGVLWTGQVGDQHAAASDQNGKNRFNADSAGQGLERATPLSLDQFTIAWYGRHYTSTGADRYLVLETLGDQDKALSIRMDSVNDPAIVRYSDAAEAGLGTNAISLNTHYVSVITVDAAGNMALYRNGVDRTVGSPTGVLSGADVNFAFSHDGVAGGWNFGTILIFNKAFTTPAQINEVGQYIDDYYAVGSTWALS